MDVRRLLVLTLISAGGLLTAGLDAGPAAERPSSAVVEQFLTRADVPLTSYRAIRRMTARNDRHDMEGWIEARTVLQDARFYYEVLGEGGSQYIRERVLRRTLAREAELISAGEGTQTDLTPQNYRFESPASDTAGLVRIRLAALHRNTILHTGTLFVSAADADLIRLQGRLAKNPSFWTRRVDIDRRYARINGVRVPVDMLSTADVRLAGRSTLKIEYQYEWVNGRPVTH